MSGDVANAESVAGAVDKTHRPRRYLPIAIATLRPLAQLEFDLFVQNDSLAPPIMYRQRDLPLEQSDIDRLIQSGLHNVFITELGQLKYQHYLEAHLEEFLTDEHTPLEVRCRFLHDAARSMLDSSFQLLNVERTLEVTQTLGKHITGLIVGRRLLPIDLYHMLRHDHRFTTHIVNVAAYSSLLAERLGMCAEDDIEEVTVGALLHDFGMRGIPRALLDNEMSLSVRERQQVHRHPQTGFEELHGREEVSWGQLMMIYQHHERCDGSGYPVKICREEIHWMARLCGIADTFDLMLRPRKNSKSMLLADVVNYLHEAGGKQFDQEMIRCWLP